MNILAQNEEHDAHPTLTAASSSPTVQTDLPLGKLDSLSIFRSICVFLLAGVCEIGGGWLMWKALRQQDPAWFGVLGGLVLAFYGQIYAQFHAQ